jgi:MFS family permease
LRRREGNPQDDIDPAVHCPEQGFEDGIAGAGKHDFVVSRLGGKPLVHGALLIDFTDVSYAALKCVDLIVGRILREIFVDSWGRKNTIAFCAVGAAVMAILFSQQSAYTDLVLFGYALAFFHDGGYSGIAPYAPELYPTRARTTGVGWANGAGRIAAILSPIVIGYLVASGIWAVFAALAAGYLLAGIVVLAFGIETRGMILEDAALETSSEESAVGAAEQSKAHARA